MMKQLEAGLHSQSGRLVCPMPMSKADFNDRDVAKVCASDDTYKRFHQAKVDAELKTRVDEMNQKFDQRLSQSIAEVHEAYGKEGGALKLRAKELASKARNTALNLACPHCKQVRKTHFDSAFLRIFHIPHYAPTRPSMKDNFNSLYNNRENKQV